MWLLSSYQFNFPKSIRFQKSLKSSMNKNPKLYSLSYIEKKNKKKLYILHVKEIDPWQLKEYGRNQKKKILEGPLYKSKSYAKNPKSSFQNKTFIWKFRLVIAPLPLFSACLKEDMYYEPIYKQWTKIHYLAIQYISKIKVGLKSHNSPKVEKSNWCKF